MILQWSNFRSCCHKLGLWCDELDLIVVVKGFEGGGCMILCSCVHEICHVMHLPLAVWAWLSPQSIWPSQPDTHLGSVGKGDAL